ncbi:MAG TPA: DNA polymerase/3'-5' exonuclease PolX [Egibacteraceae bacterium]|nr:DNA polymerase/3'-5' exonuclease PolX [Egibacteraceae bacterium]
MPWANEDVAARLAEIAALLELQGADRFRVRAYERAAALIAAAPVDLAELSDEEVAKLSGIGSAISSKIAEYRQTGVIAKLEELRADVPAGMTELVRVPGLGPKTARILCVDQGIDSVEALQRALEDGRLEGVKGVGAKTLERLRESLERMGAKDSDRRPVAAVLGMAQELRRRLLARDDVGDAEIAGSLRRMRETVGDLDILVSSAEPSAVMQAFRDDSLVAKVLAAGESKTSVLTVRGVQADLRVVDPDSWGAALIYFTGSKAHNVRLRERALRRGLTLNEYGLFDRETEERRAGRTEEEVYAALGLPWIPPTMREDAGEIAAGEDGTLPTVVTVEDLRGDLHGHSDWSGDGKASLEAMVLAAADRGWAYWAVTDHAENLSMNGLSRERMLERRRAIADLQERCEIRILDGAELNIGLNGELDYDAEFLLGFDFCVASIHSHMDRGAAEQTKRLVAAMHHPAVNVIGHPTGRRIGRRPPYDIDLEEVLGAAAETGTALEVNASPQRLDLSGEMVRRAVEGGVTLAISTDAHSIGDLDSMRFGVATAQRGWAAPEQILNCRPLDGLLEFVAAKR